MHVGIIGNGIAGINVASALSGVETVSVEVFTAETRQLYSRVRLPEVLAGTSEPDDIVSINRSGTKKNIPCIPPLR